MYTRQAAGRIMQKPKGPLLGARSNPATLTGGCPQASLSFVHVAKMAAQFAVVASSVLAVATVGSATAVLCQNGIGIDVENLEGPTYSWSVTSTHKCVTDGVGRLSVEFDDGTAQVVSCLANGECTNLLAGVSADGACFEAISTSDAFLSQDSGGSGGVGCGA